LAVDGEFAFGADESLGRVKADTAQIEQLVLNLIVNACDSMPQGGKLVIDTHNEVVDEDYARTPPMIKPGDYVVLTVTDTGNGMNEEIKARMFEPFFTTKEEGKGTGIGLATVYSIVKQSGGFITVDTAPGRGTKFEIYLPRIEENVEPIQAENVSPARARAAETVLVVEDEAEVLSLACEFLSSAGYRVLTAPDGERALEIAEILAEPIHLLVTDVVMPRMRGTALAKRLKFLRPDLKVVYMSGYLEKNERCGDFLEDAVFLQKPFSHDMLVHHVAVALSSKPVAVPVIRPS
jgi:two-component system cell cycle sensor histidine kinase/response regulator CckA